MNRLSTKTASPPQKRATKAAAWVKEPRLNLSKPSTPSPAGHPNNSLEDGAHKELLFQLRADKAKQVLLVGEFTNWAKLPIELIRKDHELWQIKLKLPPGEYRYKFLVDGEWRDDPYARKHCVNHYGSRDSIVIVP